MSKQKANMSFAPSESLSNLLPRNSFSIHFHFRHPWITQFQSHKSNHANPITQKSIQLHNTHWLCFVPPRFPIAQTVWLELHESQILFQIHFKYIWNQIHLRLPKCISHTFKLRIQWCISIPNAFHMHLKCIRNLNAF